MSKQYLVTQKELVSLFKSLKKEIGDEYRATGDEEGLPGMTVTIGANSEGWSYQTGDNSYSGGAYSYSDWAVVSLYRRTNSTQLAQQAIKQLHGFHY